MSSRSSTDHSHAQLTAELRAAGCVFAEDEARLLLATGLPADDVAALVRRRCAGEPLEYLIGWVDFCGLRIAVEPGVFIPRQRTQFLVSQALSNTRSGSIVVDLCCGSGAIGAGIAAGVPGIELYCTDSNPIAVGCARRNVSRWNGRACAGDLFNALPGELRGRIDIVTANVPYVPTAAIALLPAEARDHEPRTALDGGSDGLEILRRVAAELPPWLASGGWFGTECSRGQVSDVVDILTAVGMQASTASDGADATTVVVGARKAGG
ncbi:putative protein N(5)-glutamine methyltransferase [Skermania sp. ID1734]|uniref:putative protein N(5)-glutamine methyltransferase n=1 Tax=Skermania sp. ID1734 TaxID=2597516 RepID=UPI00117BE235|nr:putative protein N(5)-glutamine methyltransferase [Skermania sp. ID1734]TSE01449.1 putative protein N(5)-glutamine methyltransferase [Skermania sp. ID1734]